MDDRPRYMISVAADLVGMHPQTLRMYEAQGLVRPHRTPGGTRIYSEAAHGGVGVGGAEEPSVTPTGVAVFPREISLPVRRLAERSNAIIHWSEFDRGGHFAAMEEPDLLVGDLRAFFRQLR